MKRVIDPNGGSMANSFGNLASTHPASVRSINSRILPGLLCTRMAEILQVAALSNQIQTHLDAPNRLINLNTCLFTSRRLR